MARYVTGENRGGKAVPVGQAIPPLPYGEKKGSKRNCFLQPEKYFFRAGDRPENRGLTDGKISLYHMEKTGGQNGTVFCNLKNIFFGLAVALKIAA